MLEGDDMLPNANIEMCSTVTISKPASEPDAAGFCFFDGALTEYDGDVDVAKNITVSWLLPTFGGWMLSFTPGR